MLILEIVVYKIIDKIIYYISLFLCMKKREVIFIVVIIVCILLFFKYHEVPQLAPAGECGDCEEWGNDVCGVGSCASNEMHLVRYCEDMNVEDPDLPVPQLSPKFGPADLCTNMCKPLASCNSLPEFSNLFPDNVIISPIDVILSWDIYDLDNVPHVLYFKGPYTLHGAFWHTNWGHRMSHGCVNISLPHAEWLYDWSPVGTKVIIQE